MGTSASGTCEAPDGGYGKDSIEMQREKVSVFRKNMEMSLEETVVTRSFYCKVRSKEM